MLKQVVTSHLSKETDAEVYALLSALDKSVDLTPWKVDIAYDPFKSRFFVTVTAPDAISKKETFVHRDNAPVLIHNFVVLEYEHWQHHRAAQRVNIRDFGVLGDGVHDVSRAVQAAIDKSLG